MTDIVAPVSQSRAALGYKNIGYETGFQDKQLRRLPGVIRQRGGAFAVLINPSYLRQAGSKHTALRARAAARVEKIYLSNVSPDLNQTVQEAILLVQAPGLSPANNSNKDRRQVDWRRFLHGGKLASPEVERGIAVPRRIVTSATDVVALREMHEWLRQQQGRTVFLQAEAGEGKSTYLRSLSATLRETAIVLNWAASTPLNLDAVITVTRMVRSVHPGPDGEPLLALVCTELGPEVVPYAADQVLSSLVDHESRAYDIVVLVAGRPPIVDYLARRVGGSERCRLATTDSGESLALCESISRAHSELAKTSSAEQIGDDFPNLYAFLNLTPMEQAAYFEGPEQPLIIGFLRAVYGKRFVDKLVNEYEDLGDGDKRAYLHVCLATMAGIDLAERRLATLAPAADLDVRSRHDPWLRTDNDEHVARHSVIAQAVVEKCNGSTVEERFRDWINLSGGQPSAMRSLYQLITAIAYTQPLSNGDKSSMRAIKRRLVIALEDDNTLAFRIKAESGDSAARVLSWGLRLRALLPAAADTYCVGLLKVVVDLFTIAKDLATDPTLAERIEYSLESSASELTVASGGEESLDYVEERIARWRRLLGQEWAGPKFYADLFDNAAMVAELLTVHGEHADLTGDSEAAYLAYVTAGQAYAYLYSFGGPYSVFRESRCGSLINRLIYQGLPKRHIEALGEIWATHFSLRSYAQTGILYTHALLISYDKGRRTDESLVDKAITILQDVLSIEPGKPEALYKLAILSVTRRENVPFVKRQIEVAPREDLLAEATIYDASALITDQQAARCELLELAADSYARVEWDRKLWSLAGEQWERCYADLRRMGCAESARGQELKKTREKFNR